MKPTRVALLAALGMFFTSVSVYSLTPPGGLSRGGASSDTLPTAEVASDTPHDPPAVAAEIGRFTDGKTLTVEGRVGNARLARGSNGETFVMLEVKSADGVVAKSAAEVNLSLVIDRSGSMKGTRIRNAISAAQGAVDRLHDGDVVSVVTFDTQTQVVVPATTIGPGARERINASIRGIGLGGDTCISCGLEEGMRLLAQTQGKVNRILLLSDGDANHGVRDLPGFRSIAQRAQGRGVSVTTIGVDVDYNEKIMAAIAQDSNGRHYFVADDSGLGRVFEEEAQSLTRTVASDAEVRVDLAPGVELDRVFDRSFRRAGNEVIVPLGAFTDVDVKTVLLRVRVPHDKTGAVAVASVELGYRDLATGSDGRCGGKLALEVVPSAAEAAEIDPLVSGRVQRSETAAALKDANKLFEQGKIEEARSRLAVREQTLRGEAEKAKKAAPIGRAKEVDLDFDKQIAAVGGANNGFATPPPANAPPPSPGSKAAAAPAPRPQATRAGKSAVKVNQQEATTLGF
jgi:Ca-activated chloride channel family protein